MRRFALVAAFAIGFASPLAAEDTTALAQQYADLPSVQAMFDDMFKPDSLATQFRAGLPQDFEISDDKVARIGTKMAEMMNGLRPELTDMMVSGMAENFTAEELQALIEFYSSEYGASAMTKMQPFYQGVMSQLAPLILERQKAIMPELIAILQE